MPRVSGKDVLAAMQHGGWTIVRTTGSHYHLRHPERPGRVTIAVHGTATLHPKTLRTILSQATMSVDELRDIL
ncbi:MAG: type II toxin-antitoxin system HicA family toxin [Chloroflexia bacterium]|nr:type II toxin-antitoxin system HicA family toxin [Chloroflexia bacterium]